MVPGTSLANILIRRRPFRLYSERLSLDHYYVFRQVITDQGLVRILVVVRRSGISALPRTSSS